jgi:hypothetical protein
VSINLLVGELSVGELSVGESSVSESSVGQLSFGQLSVGQLPWSRSFVPRYEAGAYPIESYKTRLEYIYNNQNFL